MNISWILFVQCLLAQIQLGFIAYNTRYYTLGKRHALKQIWDSTLVY